MNFSLLLRLLFTVNGKAPLLSYNSIQKLPISIKCSYPSFTGFSLVKLLQPVRSRSKKKAPFVGAFFASQYLCVNNILTCSFTYLVLHDFLLHVHLDLDFLSFAPEILYNYVVHQNLTRNHPLFHWIPDLYDRLFLHHLDLDFP